MNNITRHMAPAAIALITIVGATNLPAAERDSYVVTPLVSDLAGKAKFQDGVLRNSWGVAFTAIADAGETIDQFADETGFQEIARVNVGLARHVNPQ